MAQRALRRIQGRKLRDLLRQIYPRNLFYRERLDRAGFDPGILERVDVDEDGALERLLAALPCSVKSDFQRDQEAHPPFGRNLTFEISRYTRQHQTSGTTGKSIRWLDTPESWEWFLDCWKMTYASAEIGSGDSVFFPFSFGPFIGFWGAFESAAAIGLRCIPGGGLSTAARLNAIVETRATVVACTPTYAVHMADVARKEGLSLASSAVRIVIVAGEPGGSIESTRSRIEGDWGARVIDHCGMTETGTFGYELLNRPGDLMANEHEFIIEIMKREIMKPEIMKPGDDVAADSDGLGELVITTLGRIGSPAIRYRTGDLVQWRESDPGEDGGEGHGSFIGGIRGRIDDMLFIRGNNVYPGTIDAIVRRFPEVEEYRVVVLESGGMADLRLDLDPRPDLDENLARGLADRVATAIRDALFFRAAVELVPPGSLPRFELKARRIVRQDKRQ